MGFYTLFTNSLVILNRAVLFLHETTKVTLCCHNRPKLFVGKNLKLVSITEKMESKQFLAYTLMFCFEKQKN